MLAIFQYTEAGTGMLMLIGLLVLLGVLSVVHKRKRFQLASSSIVLASIALLSSFFFFLPNPITLFNVFIIYPFSMFFTLLFSLSLVLVNVLSYRHSKDFLGFSMLLGFVAAGMFFVAMADSLITILLGIELVSLPTAFMILIGGKSYVEAAVKLFILAAVSIAMLTFAIVLVFPYSPQLLLTGVLPNSNITGGHLLVLALFLFIAGLAFDASLFPFNLWVPDVYQGAQGNVTALLAGINKKVAFVALFEILFVVMLPFSHTFSLAFQVLAILTMFFGNITALVQENVKRLLAYSAISQAGYIAIGIAVATQYGVEASMFQIFAHTFMIIGAFAIVYWLEENNIRSIKEYDGLSERNPLAALCLTIFMLSMIGIPPLIGFTGKFLLFTSAISQGMLILTIIAIINSLISVYYYAKVIFAMYSKRAKEPIFMDWTVSSVAVACMLVVLIVGIYPQPLIQTVSLASQSLSLI